MSTHTPGPWRAARPYADSSNLDIRGPLFVDGSSVFIAELSDVDERDANASLIAAAPELLESLKEMTALARVKWGNLDPNANALFKRAQAAIRKAKGEQ